MKVLITGATGLIGSEIVRHCQERNIAVNYLTTSAKKLIVKEGYHGFLWNPDKNEIDVRCLEGVNAVINLAGSSISKRWTPTYKKEVLASRVNTLKTLYSAIESNDASSIRSFVSASAIGIYPDSLTKLYTEEETEIDASFLGEVVCAWETEVDPFKKFDFSVSKVRIGLVMSDKGGALPEMAKPINAYVGAAFGSGQQWQSWIHVSDLARMFLFIAENELEGIFNGVAPNPVTNSKLVKEIAKVLKRPLFLPNIPRFIMKALLGEMSYILFASQRVSSKKIEEEGFVFHNQNICFALEGIYQKDGKVAASERFSQQKQFIS